MGTYIRVTVLALLLGAGGGLAYLRFNDPWMKKARLESYERMSELAQTPNSVEGWPPKIGKHFPQIALVDHTGNPFDLKRLSGKPTLMEIVAMSCSGCQAWSGGKRYGNYGGFPAEPDLDSIDVYFKRFTGGLDLDSDKLNFVQIIIYNLRLEPAGPEDLESWRKHFHFDSQSNAYVLSGGAPLANQDSYNMVPGFLLFDKDMVLRFDATGHAPRHNLYTELLPAVRGMLTQ